MFLPNMFNASSTTPAAGESRFRQSRSGQIAIDYKACRTAVQLDATHDQFSTMGRPTTAAVRVLFVWCHGAKEKSRFVGSAFFSRVRGKERLAPA